MFKCLLNQSHIALFGGNSFDFDVGRTSVIVFQFFIGKHIIAHSRFLLYCSRLLKLVSHQCSLLRVRCAPRLRSSCNTLLAFGAIKRFGLIHETAWLCLVQLNCLHLCAWLLSRQATLGFLPVGFVSSSDISRRVWSELHDFTLRGWENLYLSVDVLF